MDASVVMLTFNHLCNRTFGYCYSIYLPVNEPQTTIFLEQDLQLYQDWVKSTDERYDFVITALAYPRNDQHLVVDGFISMGKYVAQLQISANLLHHVHVPLHNIVIRRHWNYGTILKLAFCSFVSVHPFHECWPRHYWTQPIFIHVWKIFVSAVLTNGTHKNPNNIRCHLFIQKV